MHLNQLSRQSFDNREATRRYLFMKLLPFLQWAGADAGQDLVTLAYDQKNRATPVRKRATAREIYEIVLDLVATEGTPAQRIGLKVGNKRAMIQLGTHLARDGRKSKSKNRAGKISQDDIPDKEVLTGTVDSVYGLED